MAEVTSYLEKPWLKSYKLGPYKLDHSLAPYPEEPVYKALDNAAEKYPGQTAVLYEGRSMKYIRLKNQVDRLAAALIGLGLERGERVCLFLPNCLEFILSDWAVMKAGAVVVPTSVLRSEEGLLHEAGNSNSKIIICREEQLEKVLAIKDRCEVEHVIVTSTQGYDIAELSISLPPGVHEFRALLEENEPIEQGVQVDPREDLCELAFTGGATGTPKGVMVTHFNRYSCILQSFPWVLKPMLKAIAGKASILIPVPLFHAYGHYLHQAGAQIGLRVILMPDPRDMDRIVECINEYRPFIIPAVPTQLMRVAEAKLDRMNVIPMSGSAPLPMEVALAIKEQLGMPVSEGYGLTETSPLVHFNIAAFSKLTGFMTKEKFGIGVPLPDTECKLVDPELNEEVPFGEPGEVCVRGPQIMKGYWPEPGSGLTEDGWLHTGDIAVMDEDGYFQIVDRIKDMVNVSGLKVYTTKVDEVLYQHPAVYMAAAFGIPDPEVPGSERVMAVIQLKPDYQDEVTSDHIREYCKERLAPYEVPKYVQFRDDMPLTVTEKVFKKYLRDAAVAEMKESEK